MLIIIGPPPKLRLWSCLSLGLLLTPLIPRIPKQICFLLDNSWTWLWWRHVSAPSLKFVSFCSHSVPLHSPSSCYVMPSSDHQSCLFLTWFGSLHSRGTPVLLGLVIILITGLAVPTVVLWFPCLDDFLEDQEDCSFPSECLGRVASHVILDPLKHLKQCIGYSRSVKHDLFKYIAVDASCMKLQMQQHVVVLQYVPLEL